MPFEALPTEIKARILGHLVNITTDHGQVRIVRDDHEDAEERLLYDTVLRVFLLNSDSWDIAWDHIALTALVDLTVTGGPDVRPSLLVPVLTDRASDVAKLPIVSRRAIRIAHVVIRMVWNRPPSSRLGSFQAQTYRVLLPTRSLVQYVRFLAAKQGGALPPCLTLAPEDTPGTNQLEDGREVRYDVSIRLSNATDSRPRTRDPVILAFQPLHQLGNYLALYVGQDPPRILATDMSPEPQRALIQWHTTMYSHLRYAKERIDSIVGGCYSSVYNVTGRIYQYSLPGRIYDVAMDSYRFALCTRSLAGDRRVVDRKWFHRALWVTEQLAICAVLSLMSMDLMCQGRLMVGLDSRQSWPRTDDECSKIFCPCRIIRVLGTPDRTIWGIGRAVQYGLGRRIWLVAQHWMLVYHCLPHFNIGLPDITELVEELEVLRTEMKRELGFCIDDLDTDIVTLNSIREQWARVIAENPNASSEDEDFQPFALTPEEEAEEKGWDEVILGRLRPVQTPQIITLDIRNGRPALVPVLLHSLHGALSEAEFLGKIHAT